MSEATMIEVPPPTTTKAAETEERRRRTEWDAETRYQTSMQMSQRARRQMCAMADQMGVSRAGVVEMAVRKLYKQKFPEG